MRILTMADTSPSPDSGAAGTDYQTVLALRRMGHEVDTVWADDLPHRVRHGNLHYLLELPLAYRAVLLERLQRASYEVVQVSQPHGYLAARALKKARKESVFVHRSHGFEGRVSVELGRWSSRFPLDPRAAWRVGLSRALQELLSLNQKMIAEYADGHVVSTSECGEFLHERLGVERHRIAVVPQAPPRGYQEAPTQPMSPGRLMCLLYVGQFAFIKAPMVLAEAVTRVLSAVPDARFTWVCGERDHERAKALFDNPAVLRRVTLEGWCSQSDLQGIYDRHGLFLFPSFFEGFGKAFLEAMARGLVVVAARNGGMKDVIQSGENGVLVPTGDAISMAEACVSVMGDWQQSRRIVAAARRTALAYTWDRVADETTGFFRRLLDARLAAASA